VNVAEHLPFPDDSFDAAMTTFSVHQWSDLKAGPADPAARQACSAWSFVDAETRERYTRTLRDALASGAWDREHGHLRTLPHLLGSLVLIRALPAAADLA
jgi:hypothetical protein